MRGWRLPVLVLLSLMLSSCGFQLRGSLPLEKYPAVYLQGDKHSELLQQLGTQLERNQVKLLDSSDTTAAIFVLDSDSLQRRTLSLFPNGQVAEYELIYKVNYQLILPGQEPRPYQIELYRDYQDDPSRALAKSKELDLMLTELRSQAVARIIRQFGRL
ncbi:LPS-assembly lipoprotein LptE [Rheinheimera tilapiae]|jgi:LPS-assembly lipoprotein|uniref:LPS-assembly lipoprotein LptE n=1 Tax=Rheinheimera tilapiae TaxID=875043 RepID=A0ABV6BA20_9GAMM